MKNWHIILILSAFALLAGMVNGLNETISHHYSSFADVFPNANPFYWNPALSWQSKYEGGIYAQGADFLGSTTFLVFLTDAYHLTNLVELISLTIAAVIAGALVPVRRPVLWICVGITYCLLLYVAGFHAVYTFLF